MARKRRIKDLLVKHSMFILSFLLSLLIPAIALGLFIKSRYVLNGVSITSLLFSSNWHPTQGYFGMAAFIMGTVWVTAVAFLLAVPPSLLTAVYLSEYAAKRTRDAVKPILDLLAGISPVIFGVFGVIAIVPFVNEYLSPLAGKYLGFIPLFSSSNFTGFSIISAGIVLAMMIFPIITQVAEEVIHNIPQEARESSLALGATRWETIKYVVIKKAAAGIIAAVILGLSRAFGETIAVLMVVGNVVQIPRSLFDAGYTLPGLIANNYGEMMSIPLYDSALLLAALILLAVTVFFNCMAWSILLRVEGEYV